MNTTVNAGVASAIGGIPSRPRAPKAERALLEEQVTKLERKAAKARAEAVAADAALSDARSQLAAFAGDADG